MKVTHETKVGLLAAVSITLLILGYNFLKGDQIFEKNFELKAYYDNIDGLNIGNPVIFNGLKVGQVRSLEIERETGKITVLFVVDRGIMIPVDSRAIIYASDLLGSKAVRIDRGAAKAFCKTGGVIFGEVQASLGEQVQQEILPLKDKLQDLLVQMERFMGSLNQTFDETNSNRIDNIMENFTITAKNLAKVSYDFEGIMAGVDDAVGRTNSVMQNLKDQNEVIEKIMVNTATFTDSLVASTDEIRSMIRQTTTAIADIERLIEKVEKGEGSLGKLVTDDSFYNNLNETTMHLDTLIRDFKTDRRVDLYHRLGTPRNFKEEEKAREKREAAKIAEKEAKSAEKAEEKAQKKMEKTKVKEEVKDNPPAPEKKKDGDDLPKNGK